MKKRYFLNQKPQEIKRIYSKSDRGLSTYQVNLRESQGLTNKVEVKVNRTYLDIIIKNVFTFFNILLVIIGIILIAAGQWSSCVFLLILFANLLIGLIQDIRAKRMVDKLSLTTTNKVRVIREKKIKYINPSELVLDDVMILRNDESVPCDGKVLSGLAHLNESLLTGESVPCKKIVGNNVYSGTYVLSGEIYVRVEKVGSENYIQQLQTKTKDFKRPKSQIYSKLNFLFKIISIIVILIGLLMLIEYGFLKNAFGSWDNFVTYIAMMAGSLVSMIPSGMYLLSSTSLAVGTINLSRKKVLVRDLYSTETLARVDTLCIDKTGTITDRTMSIYGAEMLKENKFTKDRLGAMISSLLYATKDSNYTATALEKAYGRKEIFKASSFIPFDSSIKYCAASFEDMGTLVYGALGFFDLQNDAEIKRKINKYSANGFRALAVGYSNYSIKNNKLPNKIVPIGIIILQDHIREGVVDTIKWFNENDVNIKVISGDNPLTVSKIALAAGIKFADKYISLEGMSLEEVSKIADKYNVFGRVSPEQKEMIIKTLREEKHRTVAMFGDGVNDILAMKRADVSISIKSGSRASRDIANLVLLNDDFDSLPDIVAQGRRVINNLQRTCSLFLTKTVFSISLNIFFIAFGAYTFEVSNNPILWPFSTNNFYAWEMLGIGIAAFFLALEPNNEKLEGNFLRNIFKRALPDGIVISGLIMFLFLYSYFALKDPIVGGANEDIVTISVYFISISSFFVLLETCYKFNLYRIIVYFGCAILLILMFIISIYTEFNFLQINKNLNDMTYLYLLLIMLSIALICIGINFLINRVAIHLNKKKKVLIYNYDKE